MGSSIDDQWKMMYVFDVVVLDPVRLQFQLHFQKVEGFDAAAVNDVD